MRSVVHITVGVALLAGCGGGPAPVAEPAGLHGAAPVAEPAGLHGAAPVAPPSVVSGAASASKQIPDAPIPDGATEQHRLQRVQELREDRAAAVAHAAKAVEQARVDVMPVALPEGVRMVSPADVAERRAQRQNVLLVDPRPEVAFRRGHAAGAAHVLAEALALRAIPQGATIVLVGGDGDRSVAVAAAALMGRGVPVEVVAGGLEAWEAAGQPVVRLDTPAGPDAPFQRVGPAALLAGEVSGELLDVRPPTDWAAGHVPGSRNAPASTLADMPLPSGEVLIVAADDAAAERAARTLLARGAERVRVLEGGVLAWVRAGGRLASGRQQ